MATNREERIRQLAYEIWEREGHPHGHDVEHWHRATNAYEIEMAASRLDDAGEPMEERVFPWDRTMRASAAESPDGAVADQPVTSQPAATRKRRTKAGMAAAAAGVVGAAAAVVVTVAVTKRRRGTRVETAADAALAAEAVPRRARMHETATMLSEAEPAPVAVASDAVNDLSAGRPSDGTTGVVPNPAADPLSGTALDAAASERVDPEG